jgi:hypothetical protein
MNFSQLLLFDLGVFFEDSAANVSGAQQAGIDAYRVDGVEELRSCLPELRFL